MTTVTTCLGAPGSIAARPGNALADVINAAPDDAIIAVGSASAATLAEKLIKQANKSCRVSVEPRLGDAALWRHNPDMKGGRR